MTKSHLFGRHLNRAGYDEVLGYSVQGAVEIAICHVLHVHQTGNYLLIAHTTAKESKSAHN